MLRGTLILGKTVGWRGCLCLKEWDGLSQDATGLSSPAGIFYAFFLTELIT